MTELSAEPTLREIVLRLIRPEKPRISGTSMLNLREQLATASIRPDAALKLHRSQEALDFLVRFNAQPPLLDELADIFLTVAEGPQKAQELLNPYILHLMVSEEISYAYRIVMLGASTAIMERMMIQLLRGGWWRKAEALAERLGRPLSRDEIMRLVESYTKGAGYSAEEDAMWLRFVMDRLGSEDTDLVRGWINTRNNHYRNSIY